MTDVFVQEMQKSTSLAILTLKNELAYENLRAIEKNTALLRQWRHDFLNHLTVLEGLRRANDMNRFDEYMARLTDEVAAIPSLSYTAHPVVNSILSVEITRAQEEGIEVETQVTLPETIAVTDGDLCNLLMNMLDNAREACGRMPAGCRRWMRIAMHIRGNYLFVGVDNSKTGPVKLDAETNTCQTIKTDKASHGYGLKTMEAVARRYNSKLLIEYTDDTFSVSSALLLPLPPKPDIDKNPAVPV